MVCQRCIMAVTSVFTKVNKEIIHIELGKVQLSSSLSENEYFAISEELNTMGFEILEDQTQKQIETIKRLLISKIASLDISEDFLLSDFLSREMQREYSSISKLFSQNHLITLEQYFILQRIEKVKELLFYNEYSLKEIAAKLGYKSVQYLSSQFKNITGFTPTHFKNLKTHPRQSIDSF